MHLLQFPAAKRTRLGGAFSSSASAKTHSNASLKKRCAAHPLPQEQAGGASNCFP
jgi:hypothetical protein